MRKATDDPVQVAKELEVSSVLAGTYQRVGDTMRVSVQLIDHGAARWAGRYDLQGHDMLRFEDDIAQKVVGGLSVQLERARGAIAQNRDYELERGVRSAAAGACLLDRLFCEFSARVSA
jgi:hypothetical protein